MFKGKIYAQESAKKQFDKACHYTDFDLYYDCWAIAEFANAKIDDDNIKIIDYDIIIKIVDALGGSLKSCKIK